MGSFCITTSWDDGHRLDLRLADLLDRYGLRGTFYIARDYLDERMTDDEIRALAGRHEIGAHTLTHPVLTGIPPQQAQQEITDSGRWLAELTGRPITAFCPPRGATSPQVQQMIAAAGYETARGVGQYQLGPGPNRYDMQTTVHLYPFPLRPVPYLRARAEPLQRILPHVWRLRLPLRALKSWPAMAAALLERAGATGGVWHLWGHSWEVERFGLWGMLEDVLAAAAAKPGARHLTNSELARELFSGG